MRFICLPLAACSGNRRQHVCCMPKSQTLTPTPGPASSTTNQAELLEVEAQGLLAQASQAQLERDALLRREEQYQQVSGSVCSLGRSLRSSQAQLEKDARMEAGSVWMRGWVGACARADSSWRGMRC